MDFRRVDGYLVTIEFQLYSALVSASLSSSSSGSCINSARPLRESSAVVPDANSNGKSCNLKFASLLLDRI